MLVSTSGIVLQTVKYSDHSLIVKIFTKKNGVVSFIIKNAYSKKSKQPVSFFAALTILDIIYNEPYTEKLSFLKEVHITHPFHNIYKDIRKNTLFLFYHELLTKLLYQATAPDEKLFDFLVENLLKLENVETVQPDFHIRFLLKLVQQLGYAPQQNFSLQTPYFSIEDSNFSALYVENSYFLSKETSFYLFQILKENNNSIPDKNTRMELLNGLLQYLMKYNKQIKEIESINILSEVFS